MLCYAFATNLWQRNLQVKQVGVLQKLQKFDEWTEQKHKTKQNTPTHICCYWKN